MPAGVASLLKRRKRRGGKKGNKKPWEVAHKKLGKQQRQPSPSCSSGEEEEDEDPRSNDDDGDGFESNTDEDYSDTQEERKEEYRKGGYHPVEVGEVYNKRYRTVHKLGWGYFSTVWLCWDYQDKDFKAIKFQKSAEHYREAAFDEIKLLDQIMQGDPNGEKCCAYMTDHFEHRGPHGTHVCMVFHVLGENLLKIIQLYDYKGIPLPVVRSIAKRVLIGLDYLHRELKIIHTDLKPENVLLATPIKRIRDIIDKYKPPPLHGEVKLVDKDPATLSKSQKRRLKAKLKQQRQKESECRSQSDATGEGGAAAGEEAASQDGDTPGSAPAAANGGPAPAVPCTAAAAAAAQREEEVEEDPRAEQARQSQAVLADFGNGCWTYKQFTDDVQTRQYRAPEVLLGEGYSTPCDVWSCACMIFELITGEFLFDPRNSDDYDRDEDHLALMIELMGPLPPRMSRGSGKFRDKFLTRTGTLRHITNLKYWGISAVLHEKYKFTRTKADEIANFLLPMLNPDPMQRATAQEMLVNFADWFEAKPDDSAPYVPRDPRRDGADSYTEEGEDDEEGEETGDDSSGYDDRGGQMFQRVPQPAAYRQADYAAPLPPGGARARSI